MSCDCPTCGNEPFPDKCYKDYCASCLVVKLPEAGEWGRYCESCSALLDTGARLANVTSELIGQIMGGSTWGR